MDGGGVKIPKICPRHLFYGTLHGGRGLFRVTYDDVADIFEKVQ